MAFISLYHPLKRMAKPDILRQAQDERVAKTGWGGRIRTSDHRTKTCCLTAWPRPKRNYQFLLSTTLHQMLDVLHQDP